MSEKSNNPNTEDQLQEEMSESDLGGISGGSTPKLMQYCATGKHLDDEAPTTDNLVSTE